MTTSAARPSTSEERRMVSLRLWVAGARPVKLSVASVAVS